MGILFDNSCFICNSSLIKDETGVCRHCTDTLPRTNFHLIKENIAEQLFFGKEDIVKAGSFCYYNSGSPFQTAVHKFKYQNNPRLALILSQLYATEIAKSGWFDGIDAIIPVPIHYIKQISRGYNQSQWIAKGINKVTGIPILSNALIKTKNNLSQTNNNLFERHNNTLDIYKLKDTNIPENILLVDDVLTSGATLISCVKAIKAIKNCNISILTLGIAG